MVKTNRKYPVVGNLFLFNNLKTKFKYVKALKSYDEISKSYFLGFYRILSAFGTS